MNQPTQERIVDALATTPLVSVASVNLISLNELLETATLTVGFVAGLFALFFQVRRWYRSRKRDQAAKTDCK